MLLLQKEGVTNVTTETGAGQWELHCRMQQRVYGLEAAVYQVKNFPQQKPYRSLIMRITFGAMVEGVTLPCQRVRGRTLLHVTQHPGSLGTAISEAIELTTTTPNCKYTLRLCHESCDIASDYYRSGAEKQMEMAGEYPDKVIACFGGGSNFEVIAFPFMRHNFFNDKENRVYSRDLTVVQS